MNADNNFLCICCRGAGHRTADCQRWKLVGSKDDSLTSEDPLSDKRLLENLPSDPSSLCERCTKYNLLELFDKEDIVDFSKRRENRVKFTKGWVDDRGRHDLVLGRLKSIVLHGGCPLCRLIFRVFPHIANVDDEEDSIHYLRPFLSSERQSSFLNEISEDDKKQYSIYFSVENKAAEIEVTAKTLADDSEEMMSRHYLAFTLASKNPASKRRALGARITGSLVDYALLRHWLERCQTSHGISCQRPWADELLSTRMIDVFARRVVPCRRGCNYVALSYVWGNVSPKEGGLENHQLPQTIEDAITVTANLRIQYLWVDALCIDQTPTPQQAQQLRIMDIIYNCSTVTIIASSGESSASGLPGVSMKTPRVPQGTETIAGKQLLTIFPMMEQEMEGSKYSTRAWTMQEILLNRCRLVFTKHEVHWMCNSARFCECIDETNDPGNYTECYHPDQQESWFQNPAQMSQKYTEKERLSLGEADYRGCVQNYTRRNMSKDADSLNAFLGIVGYLTKSYFPNGLICGMPLHDFPQALRWYHFRTVTPRRRKDFPSWAWCGWQGQVEYSGSLDLTKDHPDDVYSETDLTVKFDNFDGKTLTVQGYVVTLDIRNVPFSEAFVPDTDSSLGPVRERNFLPHDNRLVSGRYKFLVVERLKYRPREDRPLRENVHMLLLGWNGGFWVREEQVSILLDPGREFEDAKPRFETVRLK